MKTLLIYDKLVTLHRDAHRHLRLDLAAQQPFSFARETNSVLLAAAELPQAALDFPCVFIETAGHHTLAALVGLRDRENLFVDGEARWARGSYVPAFIRRYPFVLAEDESQPQEFTVCVDQAYAGLNAESGQPLFDESGRESPWLQQVMQFLVGFRQEMTATREFADALAQAQLLQPRSIEYMLAGDAQKQTLGGFQVVDEERLRALPAETLQQWLQRGWLGLIYAHLLSLNQVQRLALRLDQRVADAAAAVPPEVAAIGPLH